MKKIVGVILILFVFAQGTEAIDTLTVCGCKPLSIQPFCYGSVVFPQAFVDGDTFTYPDSIKLCSGRQGIMNLYCGPAFLGFHDTSVYIISAGVPKICLASSDSNNHVVIYVDSSSLFGHSSLSLKRQVTTVSWQTVTVFLPGDSLIITDTTVNSASQSYNYRIESNNFPCSDSAVTTLHLQSNGSNLSWNSGGGLGLRGYYIYKRNGNGSFVLIDSTANFTYTDANFVNGDEYYVGAYKDAGCQSNSWRSAPTPISVKSNRLKIGTTGIEESEQSLLRYYVEGNTLNVDLKKAEDIHLHDIIGREVANQRTSKFSMQLPAGVYVLNIGAKGYKVLVR